MQSQKRVLLSLVKMLASLSRGGLSEDITKLHPSFDIPAKVASLSWPRAPLFRGRVRWQAQRTYSRGGGDGGGREGGGKVGGVKFLAHLKSGSWQKVLVCAHLAATACCKCICMLHFNSIAAGLPVPQDGGGEGQKYVEEGIFAAPPLLRSSVCIWTVMLPLWP